MQFKTKALVAALLIAGGTSGPAMADERSVMLGYTCAGCHGTDGSSQGPATPTIAGMSKETFVESMKAYQKGERPSTVMARIAKGYSEEELNSMAEFFAGKEFNRVAQEHDAAKASAGAKLHEKYCEKCHEDGGKKDEDGSSVIAGQWMPYLQFQFADFHSEARPMPKKMATRVKEMMSEKGEGSIENLVHFYGSQK